MFLIPEKYACDTKDNITTSVYNNCYNPIYLKYATSISYDIYVKSEKKDSLNKYLESKFSYGTNMRIYNQLDYKKILRSWVENYPKIIF